MNSGPPQRSVKEIASAHPEVEFALVLARTIDSATNDPEQLRSAIYELARQKLQQLTHDDPAEKARLMQALEVAIAGVEAHTKHTTIGKIPTASTGAYLPPLRSNAIGPPANSDRAMAQESMGRKAPVEVTVSRPQRDDGGRNALRWSSSTALRFTTLLANSRRHCRVARVAATRFFHRILAQHRSSFLEHAQARLLDERRADLSSPGDDCSPGDGCSSRAEEITVAVADGLRRVCRKRRKIVRTRDAAGPGAGPEGCHLCSDRQAQQDGAAGWPPQNSSSFARTPPAARRI